MLHVHARTHVLTCPDECGQATLLKYLEIPRGLERSGRDGTATVLFGKTPPTGDVRIDPD